MLISGCKWFLYSPQKILLRLPHASVSRRDRTPANARAASQRGWKGKNAIRTRRTNFSTAPPVCVWCSTQILQNLNRMASRRVMHPFPCISVNTLMSQHAINSYLCFDLCISSPIDVCSPSWRHTSSRETPNSRRYAMLFRKNKQGHPVEQIEV